MEEELNKNEWFAVFTEDDLKTEDNSETEGENKRKRRRPRKVEQLAKIIKLNNDEKINNTSFSTLQIDENCKIKALLSIITNEQESDANGKECHELLFALMANINKDPVNSKEAMQTKKRDCWKRAIDEELKSMNKNQIVNRPERMSDGKKLNILDSRWVFKRKIDANNKENFKARLVIRGFKDKNCYELRATYLKSAN